MERDYLKEPLTFQDIEKLRAKKESYDNSRIYTKEEEIVFIHKTNYPPTKSQVKAAYRAGARYPEYGYLFGEKFDYTYPMADDFIHFSINCEVSADEEDIYGFANRKYAVIMPGNSETFQQIAFFHANDVEFEGKKDITDCYILCPLAEVQEIKKNNPNSNVIPYIGKSVDDYAEAFASLLGFTIENTQSAECMWVNSSPQKTKGILQKYGFKFIEFGMDRWIPNHELQEMLKMTHFLQKVIDVALQKNINVFRIIDQIDDILADNLMNSLNLEYSLSLIDKMIGDKEQAKFWKDFLKGDPLTERNLLACLINNTIPFEKVLEELKAYNDGIKLN